MALWWTTAACVRAQVWEIAMPRWVCVLRDDRSETGGFPVTLSVFFQFFSLSLTLPPPCSPVALFYKQVSIEGIDTTHTAVSLMSSFALGDPTFRG